MYILIYVNFLVSVKLNLLYFGRDDLLSCKENIGRRKSEDSVDVIDSCMIADHSKCVAICIDGSRFTSRCHEHVKL